MFDQLYERCRVRVSELAVALSPTKLATMVPATPLWTAQELVAHLAGGASDVVNGRVDGAPGPDWTAAHVAARHGRPLDAVLAEWAGDGPRVAERLAARTLTPAIVHDALTHEADLREVFGLGQPPTDDVEALLDQLARGLCKGFDGPGRLVLRAGAREWVGGDGAVTSAETGPYELYRGLIGRRSRAQMRAWTWTGDAAPLIEKLPVFGPTEVDQPIP